MKNRAWQPSPDRESLLSRGLFCCYCTTPWTGDRSLRATDKDTPVQTPVQVHTVLTRPTNVDATRWCPPPTHVGQYMGPVWLRPSPSARRRARPLYVRRSAVAPSVAPAVGSKCTRRTVGARRTLGSAHPPLPRAVVFEPCPPSRGAIVRFDPTTFCDGRRCGSQPTRKR